MNTLSTNAPALGKHVVGVAFEKKSVGKNDEAEGKMTLYVDDKAVERGDFKTQTGHYALAGEGLAVGTDTGDPVTKEYKAKFYFAGGRVIKVLYEIAQEGAYRTSSSQWPQQWRGTRKTLLLQGLSFERLCLAFAEKPRGSASH